MAEKEEKSTIAAKSSTPEGDMEMAPVTVSNKAAKTGKLRKVRSFMEETNGGGSPEKVAGFDAFRAATAGFRTRMISGPTMLNARPDGGFFTDPVGADAPFRAKPEAVIGSDGRVQVPDTELIPWRCICHLEVEFDRGPVSAGTGFFVGERLIVTAAHVLVDRSYYGWDEKPRIAKRVRVVPGRNGSLAPYGTFVCEPHFTFAEEEWRTSQGFKDDWPGMIHPAWFRKGSGWEPMARRNDYAGLRLADDILVNGQPYGKRLGYFGMRVVDIHDSATAEMLFVNTAGYPTSSGKPYGTMWYNAGRTAGIDAPGVGPYIEYMVDTEAGQSGSPIYYYDKAAGNRLVVAIHTIGDFVNRGILITDEVFDRIIGWAKRGEEVFDDD
ncbi:MAG: trypsin-like peptidase domain-containing protein [Pseudomonadota bacterium]